MDVQLYSKNVVGSFISDYINVEISLLLQLYASLNSLHMSNIIGMPIFIKQVKNAIIMTSDNFYIGLSLNLALNFSIHLFK